LPVPEGNLPARRSASRSKYSICPFTLRNSSPAHLSSARCTSASKRRGKAFFSLAMAGYPYIVPVLMTGVAARSDTIVTMRLLIIAARRSPSSSIPLSFS